MSLSLSLSLSGLLLISVSVSDLLSISVSVSCFVCGIVAAISRFFAALIFIADSSVTVFVALIPVPAAWIFVPVVSIPVFVLVTSVAVILIPVFIALTSAPTIWLSASYTSVPFEFILFLISAELFSVPSSPSLMSQNCSSGSLYFLRLSVMILWYCSWMACEVRIPYSLYI